MPIFKITYLHRTVLASLFVFASTTTFADANNVAIAKPYEAINIQDFSKLVESNNNEKYNAETAKTDEEKFVSLQSSSLETVDLQVIDVPTTAEQSDGKMSFEDAQATIEAARRAGVIDEVSERRLSAVETYKQPAVQSATTPNTQQSNQKPKVTIIKRTPVEKPPTVAVIETDEVTTAQQPPVVTQSSETTASPVRASTNDNDGNNSTIESFENKKYTEDQTVNLSEYANAVNQASWSKDMKTNTAMTLKLQALLDWNHASPGPIDGGWGGNSRKALKNFQAMKGLETTGRMNQATWNALTANVPSKRPVLINYTITTNDANYRFTQIPSGYENKATLPAMNYNNMPELLAERFHMSVGYLKKLNPNKKFIAGETIAVFNPSENLKSKVTSVVADKQAKTLYAYSGKELVATYPTTVGSVDTPSPHGTFKIVSNVKKPHYRATVEKEGEPNKIFMLKPGPNSPVGIVWMGLSKPSYGIHGSPVPEGISRQASHGCIRLTNWDAIEVNKNIKVGAKVELK